MLNWGIVDIRANSRLSDYSIGDLEAQVAELRVGGKRIERIIDPRQEGN
jgi:N-methylhydantoinase B/oxoprolinase/acetone carboxylase alpha subunit